MFSVCLSDSVLDSEYKQILLEPSSSLTLEISHQPSTYNLLKIHTHIHKKKVLDEMFSIIDPKQTVVTSNTHTRYIHSNFIKVSSSTPKKNSRCGLSQLNRSLVWHDFHIWQYLKSLEKKKTLHMCGKVQNQVSDLSVILQYLETNSICQSWISLPFSTESWVLNQGQNSI